MGFPEPQRRALAAPRPLPGHRGRLAEEGGDRRAELVDAVRAQPSAAAVSASSISRRQRQVPTWRGFSLSSSSAAVSCARRSSTTAATAGSADSGINGPASLSAASRPVAARWRAEERTVFLVSFTTIRISQGRNGEPSRKRPSEQYALKNADCSTFSASAPRRTPPPPAGPGP